MVDHYTESIEYENDTIRLVELGGVERHDAFPRCSVNGSYRMVAKRQVDHIIIHQTAGNPRTGHDAIHRLARFFITPPKYRTDASGNIMYRGTRRGPRPIRVGGGRGWPGIGYTFVVPNRPEMQDGRLVVYRVWPDEWRTWHTGGRYNSHGVGIAVTGSFHTRHAPHFTEVEGPDPTAVVALDSLALDYLMPRYGLEPGPETLLGHFDCGKVTCPGDVLEQWVRDTRGEDITVVEPKVAARDLWRGELDSWRDRQAALVNLGFDPGPVDGILGPKTRSAVEAFQEFAGIVVDGIYGPVTERHLRIAMASAPAT